MSSPLCYSRGIVVRCVHNFHSSMASILTRRPLRVHAVSSTTQPYRRHFEKFGGAINSLDPEIKLAARFSMDKSSAAIKTITSSDDDQEEDEFFSSRGFEFIDGDNENRARVLDSDDDSSGEHFPLVQTTPTEIIFRSTPPH